MASISAGPHYEVPSTELAAWVEQQGLDHWWYIDGDPRLTGRLSMPCPGDELADELKKINEPMLVQARTPDAKGQRIGRNQLDSLTTSFFEPRHTNGPDSPLEPVDRVLPLCWKGRSIDWYLCEDNETTKEIQEEMASEAE